MVSLLNLLKEIFNMTYKNLTLENERSLYGISDSTVHNCRFEGPLDGESALKEVRDIKVQNSYFDLRYPLWHATNTKISNCEFSKNCRAPFWYDKNIVIKDSRIDGIKAIRECEKLALKNCTVNSEEFIWKCRNLSVQNVSVEESEYPFFEVTNAKIEGLKLKGKYSFQYCTDLEICNSELNTKDAFWHSKNVTVRDSVINGEYLGWYSENLTLINCKIKGTQPFCYCKNLILENCTMENCDLSFERSSVRANIKSSIHSIKNPLSGKIQATSIGEIIMEDEIVDAARTKIECGEGK